MDRTREDRRSANDNASVSRRHGDLLRCGSTIRAIGLTLTLSLAVTVAMLAALGHLQSASVAAAEDDEQPIRSTRGAAEPSPAGESGPGGSSVLVGEEGEGGAEIGIVAVGELASPTPTPVDDYVDDDVPAGAPDADPVAIVGQPAAADDDGSITIYKWLCPAGYDLAAEAADPWSDCGASQNGAAFVIEGPNGFGGEQVTGQFVAGAVAWYGLASGDYQIAEFLQEGDAYGFVLTCEGALWPDLYPLYSTKSGEPFAIGLTDGAQIVCHWFNVPSDGGDASISIVKHVCPAGDGYDQLTLDQMQEVCPEVLGGVDFHLLDGAGGDTVGTTSDDGRVGWVGLGLGQYTVREDIPDGFGAPIVWCAAPSAMDILDGNAVVFNVDVPDGIWICHWFNLPVDEPAGGNTVRVTKWACPAATDPYALPLDELYQTCSQVLAGVDFHLFGGDTPDREETTDEHGVALWYDVEPDSPYWLEEELPDGYGEPVVYCGENTGQPGEQEMAFADVWWFAGQPRITFAIEGDAIHWTCDWFNVPTDGEAEIPTVTLRKRTCPAGSDPYALTIDELSALCTEAGVGVAFHLTDAAGDRKESTDNHGRAAWYGVVPGSYGLWEEIPQGHGMPIAYCRLVNDNGSTSGFVEMLSFDGNPGVELELAAGISWYCDWFNVPDGQVDVEELGRLTVVKYWCDGEALSELTCEPYTGGQAFELSSVDGGAPIAFVTDAAGVWGMDLPDGAWTLTEIGAEWCKAESPDVNGDGDLVTRAGHETVVEVYNCAGDGDVPSDGAPDGTGTPTQLPNTGSGATGAGSLTEGFAGDAEAAVLLIAVATVAGLAALAARRLRERRHAA